VKREVGLVAEFASVREHLRGVAYRLLGSLDDADDAVQQAWLRAQRAEAGEIENVAGWFTTVTSRICLDMLRVRSRRAESPLELTEAQDVSGAISAATPDGEVELAESVGLALLVVLDRLSPAQRVAFVLHDLFGLPFDEIAQVLERSPAATKKLASRARGRVHGAAGSAKSVPVANREIVEAFLAAARGGDVRTLLSVLAPDVVRTADERALPAGTPMTIRGARAVIEESAVFAGRSRYGCVVLVDGTPGIAVAPAGRLSAVLRFGVADGRIQHYDVVADPSRLALLTLSLAPVRP
jgi:RNA polymerase sigma-70 factor, ECF subfamily